MADDLLDPTQYTPVQPHPDAVKDNLLMVFNLHHQHNGEQPSSLHCVAERWLETEEQPYERRITLTENAVPLNLGWFSDTPGAVGAIAIENNETRGLLQKLSAEEKADLASHIVEIYHPNMGMVVLVRPGWVQLLEVTDFATLKLRCQYGSAKCKVTVYPR